MYLQFVSFINADTTSLKSLLLLVFVLAVDSLAIAQITPQAIQRKNSVKLELTHLLYPRSIVFSYERVTRPYQTFCILAGYEEFPPLIDVNSDIHVKQDLNRSGFKAGADYRFYLKKENKYLAPHGTYIGPYFSFHDFNNKRELEVKVDGIDESAILTTDFNVINLGFQLGHQFVIKDRLTLDIVTLGPSISKYHANMQLDGDFTFDKDEVQNEIFLKVLDTFPLLDELLSDKELSSEGKFDSWSYGWRFQFHIGYHFGTKKKNKLPGN